MSNTRKITREQAAYFYADMIDLYADRQPDEWEVINALIVSYWSRSGLIAIKTKAWKIVDARNKQWMKNVLPHRSTRPVNEKGEEK